jgi:hypothetical protein
MSNISNLGMSLFTAASFRTIGAAAVAQNIFSIWNGSSNPIHIMGLEFQMDATAVLTGVMPIVRSSIITDAPTDGIVIAKDKYSGSKILSDPGVVIKGEVSTDGGARTPLVATPGDSIWQQYGMRMHTLVGQVLGADNLLLPRNSYDSPYVLEAGSGIVVNIVAALTTSNPATNHYFVKALWREYN